MTKQDISPLEVVRTYLREEKEGGPGYITREDALDAIRSISDLHALVELYDGWRVPCTLLASILIRVGELSFFDTDLCLAIAAYVSVDGEHEEDAERWFMKARARAVPQHPIRKYERYAVFRGREKYLSAWQDPQGQGRRKQLSGNSGPGAP